MRLYAPIFAFVLFGCAYPSAVQRIAVDYNDAAAGMANEVTLLNIVRAKEGMPLQYTGFNRLSGSVVFTGSAKLNAALRGSGVNTETTHQVAGAAVTDIAKTIVAEGVDVYTPELSGSVSSGPTFDVRIYDDQKFYQGILASVPMSTIANFLDQGIDDQLLARLLVRRVEFRLKEDVPGYEKKGYRVLTLVNEPSGPEAKNFAEEMSCYQFGWEKKSGSRKPIMPASRLSSPDGGNRTVRLQDLAVLDGQKFDLDGPLPTDPRRDSSVTVLRIGSDVVAATLRPRGVCPAKSVPADPNDAAASLPIYDDTNQTMTVTVTRGSVGYLTSVPVELVMTLRSTESVIQYLGAYLEARERDALDRKELTTVPFGGRPLFSISRKRSGKPVVAARLIDDEYFILDDENRRQNMAVLGLVQQLVNLHKESGDRPTTVPVQVIP